MRLGIARSISTSSSGGIFQYEIALLRAISEIAPDFSEEFVYVSTNPADLTPLASMGGLNYRGLPIVALNEPAHQQGPIEAYIGQQPATPAPVDPNVIRYNDAAGELLRQRGIDLLFTLSPSLDAFSLRLPFVTPIFDLNHRLQPEFPEVSAFGELNRREYFYINTCRLATLIIVDSDIGKDDVLGLYGHLIDGDRIRVLPYYPLIREKPLPSPQDCNRVLAKYNLPQRYFFYPAQFWHHKNHALIVQAIKCIADESGEVVPVVFCGAYWSYTKAHNFKEVMTLALKLGLTDRIRYLGLVPDEDMAALYSLSVGLVMPSFFGPTNLPPLEAWHFGRPVITSDIRGVREQTGDASLLVDPRSPKALADAMQRLWRDQAFCLVLGERGKKRLASYSWSSFVNNVAALLTDTCDRVRTGRTPLYPDVKSVGQPMQRT
jgi:glycosyltransferase involved in cell wall biosynthesis